MKTAQIPQLVAGPKISTLASSGCLQSLKRLGMDKFDTVYVLGSWYGSMGPYLLDKHIKFDTAYLIDIDPKNTEYTQKLVKEQGYSDRIML
jgi:hypothetical protein